jgi:hypothetical protein
MGSDPQTGYECFDELIRRLRAEGHVAPADKLHRLLHEVAWTTGSELIGELRLAILTFQLSMPALEPRGEWEGSRTKCQGFKPDLGNSAVRHYRGAPENVAMAEL